MSQGESRLLVESRGGGLIDLGIDRLPLLIQRAGPTARQAMVNFFIGQIENDHTRAAYLRSVVDFLDECDATGISELDRIEPFMVGAYVQHLRKACKLSKATVKLRLAAVRKFFDHLVVQQVLPANPAISVRGPKLKVRTGKTPVLALEEFQQLVSSIDPATLVGKRDRTWLTVAFTSWCRVSAVCGLRVGDYEHAGKRSFIRVEEKGGEVDRMPLHHKAQDALDDLVECAGIAGDDSAHVFQSVDRAGNYSGRPFVRSKVFEMVRRRARQAGVTDRICTHTFRASGITEFMRAGGRLERAQRRAHHADSRTTKLYDHSEDDVTLEDVELVQF